MKKIALILFFVLISTIAMGCEKNNDKVIISFNQTIENAPKLQAMEVEKGSTIEEPSYVDFYEEEETKYHFLGWFDGSERYEFDKPITEDVVLNARWAINNKVNGLLTNLFADSPYFSYNNIAIVKIESYEGAIILDEDSIYYSRSYDTFSKYKITTEQLLFGDYLHQFVYIIGGESTPNIFKFYQSHFLNFELPKEGEYYMIIRRIHHIDNDVAFYQHLIGHSVIKLETYDPSKALDEQDEATLSIIQPYIDRIASDNAKE